MIDQLILSNKPSNYLVTSADLNSRYLLVMQKICSEMNITKDQLENNPDVKYVSLPIIDKTGKMINSVSNKDLVLNLSLIHI